MSTAPVVEAKVVGRKEIHECLAGNDEHYDDLKCQEVQMPEKAPLGDFNDNNMVFKDLDSEEPSETERMDGPVNDNQDGYWSDLLEDMYEELIASDSVPLCRGRTMFSKSINIF